MISLASLGPTIQGRIMTTIPAPNLSSGSPKKASSDAIVMSQASASSQAPARHGPRTAARVGLGQCQKRITVSKSLRRIGRHWATPEGATLHLVFQVKPGREGGAGTPNDDRSDLRIALRFVESLSDLPEHDLVKGIRPLGTIERDATHGPKFL